MAERALPPHAHPRAPAPIFAAIDLGTNNCRLLVAVRTGCRFAVVDSFSRIVCLGEGLDRTGQLSAAAMDRALLALAACSERLARWRPTSLAAIATEACRRASNGAEFLGRVRQETGISVSIVSPREEIELAVESCASLLCSCQGQLGRRALLFDIGGGSTELAWLRLDRTGAPSLIGATSLPLGVVTLSERYGNGAFTPAGFRAMVRETSAMLKPFEAVHCIAHEIRQRGPANEAGSSVCLLGTSGTATTLAALALALPRYNHSRIDGTVLTLADADRALAALLALGRAGLAGHPCIGPSRLPFVLPGAAIFAALRSIWPAPRVIVADRGLREGMLLRLIRGIPLSPCHRSATKELA